MRMSQTQTAYDALKTRVKRLQFGQVNIKSGKKEYFGSLIDDGYIDSEGDGKLIITYNKKLTSNDKKGSVAKLSTSRFGVMLITL